MTKQVKTIRIDADRLRSLLHQKKTTREVFRLPLTKEEAEKALLISIQEEVFRRGHIPNIPSMLDALKEIALNVSVNNESSKFGLLLCGKCGNGKTTVLRALCTLVDILNLKDEYNEDRKPTLVNAADINDYYNDNRFSKLCTSKFLAIDDLGIEACEVQHYGNILQPVVRLLERRYENMLYTVITTNLTPKEISERYGARIQDRFREMLDIVVFKGESFR